MAVSRNPRCRVASWVLLAGAFVVRSLLAAGCAGSGFTIVGAIFASASGEGSPSAQQLAALVKEIKTTGAPAVFLETGNSPDLADQLAQETRAKVVTDLYIHSVGPHAASYIDMMRWDVNLIVEALT